MYFVRVLINRVVVAVEHLEERSDQLNKTNEIDVERKEGQDLPVVAI